MHPFPVCARKRSGSFAEAFVELRHKIVTFGNFSFFICAEMTYFPKIHFIL